MGYTHYWTLTSGFDLDQFAAATQDITRVISQSEIPCAGPTGHPKSQPEISPTRIALNGVNRNCTCPVDSAQACPTSCLYEGDRQDDSYETFIVDASEPQWNFCKTARKPYDTLVGTCLLILRYHLPKHFQFQSDGDWDHEWAQGATTELMSIKDTYRHIFPERELASDPMGIDPDTQKEGSRLHFQWLTAQLLNPSP